MQDLDDAVIVTLAADFNNDQSKEFVRETDFLNSMAELVRARDPEALEPGHFTIYGGTPYQMVLKGNQQRIVAAVSDVFKAAHDNKTVIISESLAGMRGEVASVLHPTAREIVITPTRSLNELLR